MGPPWLPETDALHGEKVGVGTLLALETYRGWIGKEPDTLVKAVSAWKPYSEALLAPVFGHLTESVRKENARCCLEDVQPERIAERWDAVQALLRALPEELCGRVLDLGCGWGAVGVSVGKKYPACEIVMTDVNERARELAEKQERIASRKAAKGGKTGKRRKRE